VTLNIEGVPSSLTRRQVVDLLASIGLDAHIIPRSSGVLIGGRAITCEVRALGEDGQPYVDGDHLATHKVTIPITDEEHQ